MTATSPSAGFFVVVDRAKDGPGYEAAYHSRLFGRLFPLGTHPTHAQAMADAAGVAASRGGLEVRDLVAPREAALC